MRNDLFNRESLANEERAAKRANKFDRASMLRRESAQIMVAHNQKQVEAYSKIYQAKAAGNGDYTVVLKWKKSIVYTADDLSARLSSYGRVNIAVVSKKGGSGIVSFSRLADARDAVSALTRAASQGDSEFISAVLKPGSTSSENSIDTASKKGGPEDSLPRNECSEDKTQAYNSETVLSDADFEKMVLQKLRDTKKLKPSKV
ncbi:uncharacterized protein LOC126325860 [Schistocerca gregaria]|uniref:uncharacterized protein LOC126325860 n=1 Tax=Schistocerca gregaria TaxID=7010 RepID=UPI00211EA412|nr:uncharacterized protein LOC126325860 [Schistocerca gregaria]